MTTETKLKPYDRKNINKASLEELVEELRLRKITLAEVDQQIEHLKETKSNMHKDINSLQKEILAKMGNVFTAKEIKDLITADKDNR